MENVTTIISNLGFPIACCIACVYYINKTSTQEREENRKREDRLLSQIDEFNKTLGNFNATLTSVDKRLENLEDLIKEDK